jgi:hypothetical protein
MTKILIIYRLLGAYFILLIVFAVMSHMRLAPWPDMQMRLALNMLTLLKEFYFICITRERLELLTRKV